MNILFVGDVVGAPGRRALAEALEKVIDRHRIDFTIVNVENAAGGFGLTVELFDDLSRMPIDVFSSGNHIWDKKEIYDTLNSSDRLLRPANYPPGNPGRGWTVQQTSAGIPVGVLNLQGQVFMPANADSPFRVADEELAKAGDVKVIFVDMHAEATSEKAAIGWYLDGRVSAVVGTHTHVPDGGRDDPPRRHGLPLGRRHDRRLRRHHRLHEGPDHREVPVADAPLVRDRQEGHPAVGRRDRRGRGDRQGAKDRARAGEGGLRVRWAIEVPSRLDAPLTALVTTLNEEVNLQACLESLAFADEIFVVDSYSTDRTLAIARSFPRVKIVQREYLGSAAQKNWAMDQISTPWILVVDADERVPEPLAREILALLEAGPPAKHYAIRRRNFFLGTLIRHSGWSTDTVVRLVRTRGGPLSESARPCRPGNPRPDSDARRMR